MSNRKQRVDSATAAVKIMQGATREILPPAHVELDECDQPYWRSVIAEFARSEWTDHQLELAALLARSIADLTREQKTLRIEGYIAKRENGTTVENPRARAVKGLTGDILSLRRSLSLHARARSAGDNRNVGTQREQAKGIEANNPLDDELLARPAALN